MPKFYIIAAKVRTCVDAKHLYDYLEYINTLLCKYLARLTGLEPATPSVTG